MKKVVNTIKKEPQDIAWSEGNIQEFPLILSSLYSLMLLINFSVRKVLRE